MAEQQTTKVIIPATSGNRSVGMSFIMNDPELRTAYLSERNGDRHVQFESYRSTSSEKPVIRVTAFPTLQSDGIRSQAKPKVSVAMTPPDSKSTKKAKVNMSEITREELDAKLELTTSRVDVRLASFEATVKEALSAVRQDSAEMRGELKTIHVELSQLKNLKANIWGAAGAVFLAFLGASVAIYFGIASNNQMLVSNAIAGFGAGKDIAATQAEIRKANDDALKLLQQIKQMQDSAQRESSHEVNSN